MPLLPGKAFPPGLPGDTCPAHWSCFWRTPFLSAVYSDLSSLPRVRILLGNQEGTAEIDTLASDNFVNKAILTEAEVKTLQPGPPHALLAAVGATIFLEGAVTFNPVLQGAVYADTFHVIPELRAELILGRPWLRKHRVIQDDVADCIFVGTIGRQRVYLSSLSYAYELTWPSEEVDVQSDFPPQLKGSFEKLIDLHASLFHAGGRLKLMGFLKGDGDLNIFFVCRRVWPKN